MPVPVWDGSWGISGRAGSYRPFREVRPVGTGPTLVLGTGTSPSVSTQAADSTLGDGPVPISTHCGKLVRMTAENVAQDCVFCFVVPMGKFHLEKEFMCKMGFEVGNRQNSRG